MASYVRFAILTIAFVPLIACSTRSGSAQAVSKYIQAYQKGDYKTVVDLLDADQAHIKSIKAQNPTSLWPKLVSDYYSQRTSGIQREAPGLFRPTCKWTITEKRPGTAVESSGNNVPITTTYVTVSYPSMEDSPLDGSRLKQVILAFNVANHSGLVLSILRVGAGDVYWPIPTLTSEEARAVALNQLTDSALNLHIALAAAPPAKVPAGALEGQKWVRIHYPWGGPHRESVHQEIVRFQTFLEQNGFTVGKFNESPTGQGDMVAVLLPASWDKYRLRGKSRQYPGDDFVFKVEETSDLMIESLSSQSPGVAQAKVKLLHSGCNVICAFIQEGVKNPDFMSDCCDGAASFGVRGNNHWGLFNRENLDWPDTEEGQVFYAFNPLTLKWQIRATEYLE